MRKTKMHTAGTWAAPRRHVDNAMVKAIARAFRWREMLEDGTHATIAEIASAERINESYIGRVLRLTLLAPCIVEAILDGRQSPEVTLPMLLQPFPSAWNEQAFINSRCSSKVEVPDSHRCVTGAQFAMAGGCREQPGN